MARLLSLIIFLVISCSSPTSDKKPDTGGDVLTTALLKAQADCLLTPECKQSQAQFFEALNYGDCSKAKNVLAEIAKYCTKEVIAEAQVAFDGKCVVAPSCPEYAKQMEAALLNKECTTADELISLMYTSCYDLWKEYLPKVQDLCYQKV